LPKSHGLSAEEIFVKVEQHGFRPLQSEPDEGPDRERFFSNEGVEAPSGKKAK
jgi:hypothetical protein